MEGRWLTSAGPGGVCSACPSWQPTVGPSPGPSGPLGAGPEKPFSPCGPTRPPLGAAVCQYLCPLPVSERRDQNVLLRVI